MAALELIALDEAAPQLRAPGASDTYLAPRAVAVSPPSLTGSSATSSLSISQTWNTTGTPTALSVAVTDTASNAASLLMDLRVGGASCFGVHKSGRFLFRGNGADWGFDAGQQLGFVVFGRGSVATGISNEQIAFNWNDQIVIPASHSLNWSSTGGPRNAIDLTVLRDAANTLALRNGTNAQTSRVYGTFTDAFNGRWLNISMTTGGVASITPTGNGTGASGNVIHISGLPTSNPGAGILWDDGGTVKVGT